MLAILVRLDKFTKHTISFSGIMPETILSRHWTPAYRSTLGHNHHQCIRLSRGLRPGCKPLTAAFQLTVYASGMPGVAPISSSEEVRRKWSRRKEHQVWVTSTSICLTGQTEERALLYHNCVRSRVLFARQQLGGLPTMLAHSAKGPDPWPPPAESNRRAISV